MGKNLHNDDFEDFFKKHLESFDGEPSDDMWNRIEHVIPPKPGIAWSAYALPSALILTLGLLVFVGFKMFEYKKTSENLTEQLEQSNRESQSLNDNSIIQTEDKTVLYNDVKIDSEEENNVEDNGTLTIDNSISNVNTTKNKIIKSKENIRNNTVQQSSGIQQKVVISTTKENYEQPTKETQKVEKPILPIIKNISKEVIKNTDETSSNAVQPVAKVDKITDEPLVWNSLAMKPSSIMFDNNWQLNKAVKVDKPLLEEKLTAKNSLALFVAPTVIKNNIRPPRPSSGNNPPPPNPPNNPRPIPTEKVRLGQAIGVKYGYNFTDKLALNIGGMYANTSYDFSTRHFLPYNKDTEQDISTDKAANTIDYSGSSTYGEYSVDVDVTRLKDNGITQDENIDIKVDATAKIHSVIIPAYLTYELFQVKGFSIGLKGGISYNSVIKNDLKVNDFKVEKQGFEVQNFNLRRQPKPSKNGAVNSLSGVVLAYDFKDNWSVVIEPTLSSALSDNHKADFGRTKSNIFNVDIGLKYNF